MMFSRDHDVFTCGIMSERGKDVKALPTRMTSRDQRSLLETSREAQRSCSWHQVSQAEHNICNNKGNL